MLVLIARNGCWTGTARSSGSAVASAAVVRPRKTSRRRRATGNGAPWKPPGPQQKWKGSTVVSDERKVLRGGHQWDHRQWPCIAQNWWKNTPYIHSMSKPCVFPVMCAGWRGVCPQTSPGDSLETFKDWVLANHDWEHIHKPTWEEGKKIIGCIFVGGIPSESDVSISNYFSSIPPPPPQLLHMCMLAVQTKKPILCSQWTAFFSSSMKLGKY